LDLALLTDVTEKANGLNLELQGKVKHVAQIIGSAKSFKAKPVLWMSHLKMKSLVQFPSMKKMVGESKPFSVCWPPSNTSGGVRKEISTVHRH
jgi:hypothetical protein